MAGLERGSPQWGFTSYIILILFGALVYKTGPLDSDRPLQHTEGRQNFTINHIAPARLWQDPFESIVMYQKDLKLGSSEILQHDGSKQDHPFDKEKIPGLRVNSNLKILGVMVNGGPYAEIVERRTRRRYAVISGLAQMGFIPEKVNIVKYFHWPEQKPENIDIYNFVPYEWFHDKNNSQYILVLWLQDEAFLSNPVSSFKSLIKTFLDRYSSITDNNYKFIGPATSTLLKKILKFNADEIPYTFLSATATVPDKVLGKALPDNIFRTIATDDQMAKALVKEFELRRLKTKVSVNDENDQTINVYKPGETTLVSHIAIISEHDTVFGRTMPHLIARELGCGGEDGIKDCKQIHTYSFLRGIDGITHKRADVTSKSDSKKNSGQTKKQNQPTGPSQYDYLRRLAEQMQLDENTHREKGKGGIRFVGVFGNDVYDKLLVLQAVRPYFPKAVFFTTDLDARLLQPSEYKWTRNLIVASSFGFRLKPELQGNIPPFRDSYQTSVFHAVQNSFKTNDELNDLYKWGRNFRPLVFEVGRNGAIRLNNEIEDTFIHNNLNPNPKDSARPNEKILYAIFFILAAGIFAYHQTALKLHRLAVTVWLTASWLVLAVLTLMAYNLSFEQEPFSFTDGVSVWPTIYIRAIAAMLSISLIAVALCKLKNNFISLTNDYFEPHSREYDERGELWQAIVFVFLVAVSFAASMRFVEDFYLLENIIFWSLLIAVYYWYIIVRVKIKNISAWAGEEGENSDSLDVADHWYKYGDYGQTNDRLFRSIAIMLIYLSFACILFMVLGGSSSPLRGEWIFRIDKIILVPAIISLMILLFLIVDETRLCTTWIFKFVGQSVEWPKTAKNKIKKYDDVYHEFISEWLSVQLIADRTQSVGTLVYYPFFIIVLMLVSRSTYFDGWSFPVALIIIIGSNVLITIYCATRLRYAAEKARLNALDNLTMKIIELKSETMTSEILSGQNLKEKIEEDKNAGETESPATKKTATAKQKIVLIEELIKDISLINTGAFQPLKDQPIVRATIIVFGAAGLTMAEYLRLSN